MNNTTMLNATQTIFNNSVLRNNYFNGVAEIFALCLVLFVIILMFRKVSKKFVKYASITDLVLFFVLALLRIVWDFT